MHDGLDKVQRRSLKRKLRTVLRRFSQKHKKTPVDKGKGKQPDGEDLGQSEETEGGMQMTGELAQGQSSGETAHAGVAVIHGQTSRDVDQGGSIPS